MSPVALHVEGDDPTMHAALLYPADVATTREVLFVMAHGAGAGQSSPWMVRYAKALAERGLDVVTFNFPYIQAGRKAPDRAPVLESAFRRVIVSAATHRHVRAGRLLIGGKSMGGRIATHLAATPDAWPSGAPRLNGVVVFGYPLNPPGGAKQSADRISHLQRITVPTLIVQGSRDSFGGPDDIRRAVGSNGSQSPFTIYGVDGGDHSLAIRKSASRSQADIDQGVFDAVVEFSAT